VTVQHVDAGPPERLPKDALFPYLDAFAQRLAGAWRTRRPDVVHAHFWMSGRAALAAARPLDVPVVQTFHALGVVKRRHQGARDTSPPGRIAEESRIIARASGIVATCRDEVRELERLGGDRARMCIVPCGVDLCRFTPRGPTAPRRLRHRLLAIGRLVERKGLGDVVSALSRLPDTELVIAGGPRGEAVQADPEARRLMTLARRLGVADRLVFVGGIDQHDVPALLRSADVAVNVPWYEPFGIAPLEAMACGVPVVGSAVGGMLDTIVDGVTGVLIPPRDPSALAAALAPLLADAERRSLMGRAGAARAHLKYGWDRVGGATVAAYERLLTPAARAPLAARATPLRGARRQGGRGLALVNAARGAHRHERA
jgi:D-inositol-3-phosphate glycosyltransferase